MRAAGCYQNNNPARLQGNRVLLMLDVSTATWHAASSLICGCGAAVLLLFSPATRAF
jgi:hypothetical protein